MKLFGNMKIKEDSLYIGDISAQELAEVYGTPIYIYDEELIKENCRKYTNSLNVEFGKNKVAYAGKAFLTKYMVSLINEEGMNLDVVSEGELFVAKSAGFPMEKIIFHGNNKSKEELEMALEYGVGHIVVDGFHELDLLESICQERAKHQNIYLRVSPGIEAHTHDYIKTGQIDSKFGFSIATGDLIKAIEKIKSFKYVKLKGLHAHIGSQIFDIEPYLDELEVMLKLFVDINKNYGLEMTDLNLGGGIGVYYTGEDNPVDIKEFCLSLITRLEEVSNQLGIESPNIILEPGRSIIANAGSTLYTVGSIKEIEGIRTYVSVDGGMTDNIRPALYKAQYECALANKMNQDHTKTYTIAGKCCESGDILITDAKLPEVESGDLLIVGSTGAYGYSMASNYNRIRKPAVVAVNKGESSIIVKRESLEDLIRLEP